MDALHKALLLAFERFFLRVNEPEMRAQLASESGLHPRTLAAALLMEQAMWHRYFEQGEATASGGGQRAGPVLVWLSANITTAPLRALAMPILHGVPVLAKASSRARRVPELLSRCFDDLGGPLSRRLQVLPQDADTREVLREARRVHVYGSDAAIAAVERGAAPGAKVTGFGPGIGVGWVDALHMRDARRCDDAARRLAWDAALHDQRGCLSPRLVWLEGDDRGTHRRFARCLFQQMQSLGSVMPRGPAPLADAWLRWRARVALCAEVYAGDEGSVALLDTALHQKPSDLLPPAHRHLLLLPAASPVEALERAGALAKTIKSVALSGLGTEAIRRWRRALACAEVPRSAALRIAALGQLQAPPMAACWDGYAWVDILDLSV